jgi:hypothetical protein
MVEGFQELAESLSVGRMVADQGSRPKVDLNWTIEFGIWTEKFVRVFFPSDGSESGASPYEIAYC